MSHYIKTLTPRFERYLIAEYIGFGAWKLVKHHETKKDLLLYALRLHEKDIIRKFGCHYNYKKYLARKQGFNSLYEQRKYYAKLEGFKNYREVEEFRAIRKGFKNYREVEDHNARKLGFIDHKDRARYRSYKKKNIMKGNNNYTYSDFCREKHITLIKSSHKTTTPISHVFCVYCSSTHTTKFGSRKRKNSKVQRFFCKTCGKSFINNNIFKKQSCESKIIEEAMRLSFELSVRKIQKQLFETYFIKLSHSTIWNWIKKYPVMLTMKTKTQMVDGGAESPDESIPGVGLDDIVGEIWGGEIPPLLVDSPLKL